MGKYFLISLLVLPDISDKETMAV